MSNTDNVSDGYKVKTIDFRDKEWSDQFNNLSKMLDQYLISADASTNTQTQTNLQSDVQAANKNEAYSYRPSSGSVNAGKIPVVSKQNQHISPDSYLRREKVPNSYKYDTALNTNTVSSQPRSYLLETNPAIYPQRSQDLKRPQHQPNHPSEKKVSPERQQPSNGVSRNKSSDHNSQHAFYKVSPKKSPKKVLQEQTAQQSSPHKDYGPRDRRPYGQARSPTRSPPRELAYQPTRYNPSLRSNLQSQIDLQMQESSGSDLKKNHYIRYIPTYRARTPSNVSSALTQWAGAINPYKKQDYSQPNINITSLNTLPIGSMPDFQIQTTRSLYNTATDRRSSGGNPFGMQDPSIYSSRINLRVASPSNQYQEQSFGSPDPSGKKILDYFRTLPYQESGIKMSPSKRIPSPQTRISPRSFYGSPDSRSPPRKNSTENLVGENQNKLEQSVFLQKQAEDAEKTQESPQITAQGPQTQASNNLKSTPLNKTSNPVYTRPGTSQIRQYLSNSGEKLVGKNYSVIIEHYSDGTKYEGEKYSNKRHGRGTFYYKEGLRYEGSWEDGMITGFGVLWLDEKNKIYEGEWYNNAFHGRGTLYNPEYGSNAEFNGIDFRLLRGAWTKFEGLFNSGVKEGLGTLFVSNGDVFVGTFARDVVHGRGSYTPKIGKPFLALWRENILLEKY